VFSLETTGANTQMRSVESSGLAPPAHIGPGARGAEIEIYGVNYVVIDVGVLLPYIGAEKPHVRQDWKELAPSAHKEGRARGQGEAGVGNGGKYTWLWALGSL